MGKTRDDLKSKKQLKQDAKERLIDIKSKLKWFQIYHLLMLIDAVITWVIKVVLLDQVLDCSMYFKDIMDSLQNNENNELKYHPSVSIDYANQLEEDHIQNLIERHCLNYTETEGSFIYGDAIPQGNIENAVYACTECVPLPYEGILPPNALDWYSPLHWWDFGLIIVALSVQFRLKTIDDSKKGSFGPLVVDEKDIAITSAHIMTISITIFFYCIEVAISSMWLHLHDTHDLLDDHASYYTVYERNKKLTIWNSVWLGQCLIPMFCLACKIKKQIQTYEQNQFLTEL